MKPARLNNITRAFAAAALLSLSSCIKPFACECENVQTKQKSHVLVYATKKQSSEACRKNGQDSTVVCYLK